MILQVNYRESKKIKYSETALKNVKEAETTPEQDLLLSIYFHYLNIFHYL